MLPLELLAVQGFFLSACSSTALAVMAHTHEQFKKQHETHDVGPARQPACEHVCSPGALDDDAAGAHQQAGPEFSLSRPVSSGLWGDSRAHRWQPRLARTLARRLRHRRGLGALYIRALCDLVGSLGLWRPPLEMSSAPISSARGRIVFAAVAGCALLLLFLLASLLLFGWCGLLLLGS